MSGARHRRKGNRPIFGRAGAAMTRDCRGDGTRQRILQEVACADDWNAVSEILHRHQDYYYRLSSRDRYRLNAAIKDLMGETRLDGE